MAKINDAGLALLRAHEGLRLEAYLCPGGVWTIGYGHTATARPGMKISRAQAEHLLCQDVAQYEQLVRQLVAVPLNANQFSALVSFCFNVGPGAFERSTLRRLLNRGWYDQVPAQLLRWTRVAGRELAGLRRRRQDEANLWQENL